jgi:hypothetical protein
MIITDYIGVDESGVVSLHIMMLGSYQRRFDVLISQIPCHSENAGLILLDIILIKF